MPAGAVSNQQVGYVEAGWSFAVERTTHPDAGITHVAFAKPGPWEAPHPSSERHVWYAYGGSAAEALMFVHCEVGGGQQFMLA